METGTYISLGEAAKLAGVSKATISKALKSGKISYYEKTKAGYKIDPAEVTRVYPPKRLVNVETERSETPNETSVLQARVDALEQMLQREKENADEWRKQAQNLAITNQNTTPKKWFWQK